MTKLCHDWNLFPTGATNFFAYAKFVIVGKQISVPKANLQLLTLKFAP
jgi:hypothetical protein